MRKGFTLLELVVVIVIIGILAAIAIPTFAAVIDRAHTSSAKQTADSIVAEAKALYAFDNNGGVGVDLSTFPEADLPATATGWVDTAGVVTFDVSGKTVTFASDASPDYTVA